MFDKITNFSKIPQGTGLKVRGRIFWILVIYIHILTPVKTEFAKRIKMVDFRGGVHLRLRPRLCPFGLKK